MKNYQVVHCTFRKSGAQEAMVKYAHLNPVLCYTASNGWEIRVYS